MFWADMACEVDMEFVLPDLLFDWDVRAVLYHSGRSLGQARTKGGVFCARHDQFPALMLECDPARPMLEYVYVQQRHSRARVGHTVAWPGYVSPCR